MSVDANQAEYDFDAEIQEIDIQLEMLQLKRDRLVRARDALEFQREYAKFMNQKDHAVPGGATIDYPTEHILSKPIPGFGEVLKFKMNPTPHNDPCFLIEGKYSKNDENWWKFS